MTHPPVVFPVDYDKVRIALVRELQRVTRVTCIVAEPEEQAEQRPAKPYFTVKLIGPGGKQGDDSSTQTPNTTMWTVAGQRKVTTDFNCYGLSHEQAYDYMSLWQSALETETTQANLRAAGIAVWLNNDIKDLSELLETAYEGRSHLEVTFGVAANVTEDRSEIETVNVSGKATTDQDDVVDVLTTVTAP